MKRKGENTSVEVKNYQGLNETDHFSQQLTFNPSMFDDHMPGGYDYIFKGLPDCKIIVCKFCSQGIGNLTATSDVEVKILKDLLERKDEKGFRKKFKKKWRVFKTNTKEFFKGLG